MLSNVNLNSDLTLLRPRGTVVVVGCRGDVNINPRLLMGPETSIVGCANFAASPVRILDGRLSHTLLHLQKRVKLSVI